MVQYSPGSQHTDGVVGPSAGQPVRPPGSAKGPSFFPACGEGPGAKLLGDSSAAAGWADGDGT